MTHKPLIFFFFISIKLTNSTAPVTLVGVSHCLLLLSGSTASLKHEENVHFISSMLKWLRCREGALLEYCTIYGWCELWAFRNAGPTLNTDRSWPWSRGVLQEIKKLDSWCVRHQRRCVIFSLKWTMRNVHLKEVEWDGDPLCRSRHESPWEMFMSVICLLEMQYLITLHFNLVANVCWTHI